jgi:hypothetical protein
MDVEGADEDLQLDRDAEPLPSSLKKCRTASAFDSAFAWYACHS